MALLGNITAPIGSLLGGDPQAEARRRALFNGMAQAGFTLMGDKNLGNAGSAFLSGVRSGYKEPTGVPAPRTVPVYDPTSRRYVQMQWLDGQWQPISPVSQGAAPMPMGNPVSMPAPQSASPVRGRGRFGGQMPPTSAYGGAIMPTQWTGDPAEDMDRSIEEQYFSEDAVPGTDMYYEQQTGQPVDLSPQQPARVPGRFGGNSLPTLGQKPIKASAEGAPSAKGDRPAPAPRPEKLTEGQSKDVVYYNRAIYANDDLTQLETALQQQPDAALGGVPLVGGAFKSPDYMQAERAAREFLAVVLRKDTGAAVTAQEFALYGPMYIPSYWDDPQTLADKRAARQRFLEGMYRAAGTAQPILDDINAEFSRQQEGGLENLSDEELMRQLLGGN